MSPLFSTLAAVIFFLNIALFIQGFRWLFSGTTCSSHVVGQMKPDTTHPLFCSFIPAQQKDVFRSKLGYLTFHAKAYTFCSYWSQVESKLIQCWFNVESILIQIWFKVNSKLIQNWFKIDSNFKVDSMLIQSWFKRYSELRKLHYLINVCSKLCNKIGWNVYKITSRVYLECIRPTWFLLLFVKRASGEVGVVALFPSLLLLALAPSMRRFSAKRCSHCTLEPTLCFPPLVLWAQFLPPHWGSRWQRGNKHTNIRLSYTTTM